MDNELHEAVRALKHGRIIAFPTETVFGIGCDPRKRKAVAGIFRLKGRTRAKALPLVASSMAQVERVALLKGGAKVLAKKHWPGPLTLILPVRPDAAFAPGIVQKNEVAIRVSGSPLVRSLCRAIGFPLAATSANRSGLPERESDEEVRREFGDSIDVIVDGGISAKKPVSTIVRVGDDGEIRILRKGAIRL